jgi:hypothetical protein
MIKGFGNKIMGTVAHGFNGGFDPAESRHPQFTKIMNFVV